MALGPGHPTWTMLYDELAELARACGGTFAFVLDEGNGLWCVGIAGEPPTTQTEAENRFADRVYEQVIAPRSAELCHGSSIEHVSEGADRYYLHSFGIYALVVAFAPNGEFPTAFVRARVKRALPKIEALVLSLPPSGGPGSEAAAGKVRA